MTKVGDKESSFKQQISQGETEAQVNLLLSQQKPEEPTQKENGNQARKDAEIPVEVDNEKEKENEGGFIQCLRPLFGMLSILMAGLSYVTYMTLVKMTQFIDPFTMCFFRFAIFTLLSLPMVIYRGDPIAPAGYRLKLLARSILGASVIIIKFFALQYVPIGEVNTLAAATPAITVFLAWLFLKEKIAFHDIFNMILVVSGMLLIAQPPIFFGNNEKFGSLLYTLALISLASTTVIQSTVYILIRMLRDLHFSTMIFFYGCVGALVSLVVAFVIGTPRLPQNMFEVGIILAVGILAFATQTLTVIGLQLENAAVASLLRKTSDISFSFIAQFAIFQDFPNSWGIAGIALILLVVFTSGLRKIMAVLPSSSFLRNILGYVLCSPLQKQDNQVEIERKRQHSINVSENEIQAL